VIVIVIAGRPQEAVHAGGDDCQPPAGIFYYILCLEKQCTFFWQMCTSFQLTVFVTLFVVGLWCCKSSEHWLWTRFKSKYFTNTYRHGQTADDPATARVVTACP